MVNVLELLTVNVAVTDLEGAVAMYERLGIEHVKPNVMDEPPASITDVSFPLAKGAISLIHPTVDESPVGKFLDRKGQGVYSIAIRVNDIQAAMNEWGSLGFEWVLKEPHVIHDGSAVQYRVERLLMNWIKPSSFRGVMLEVFEFQGSVEAHA